MFKKVKGVGLEKKRLLHLKTSIVNELGLHARPAAKIAEMVISAQGKIWLKHNGNTVDASSVIDILTMGCVKGSFIQIEAENINDVPVLQKVRTFIEEGFGELKHE